MANPSYPTITEASLTPFRAIEVQLTTFPDLLDRAECPYPPLVKAMLRRLIGGEMVDTGTSSLSDAAERTLDDEIAAIYQSVRREADHYSGSDPKDKMSFLKTSNDLLTKLVDLQSRRINIRNMALTQRAVVEAMEEFLTPAQRTQFIDKLGTFIDVV